MQLKKWFALGRNLKVAYAMERIQPWGCDCISEKVVQTIFTSIHVDDYSLEVRY
jgi:hypothetical protein